MQLVIDSATAACSVALIGGDGALAGERHEVVGRGHAERLMPMIQDLLAGRAPSSILVGCGPGSFTGTRVGLAAAHGLSIGWGVPLLGYSSMALIAAATVEPEVAVALHGGHGELFVQTFAGEPLAARGPLLSLAPDAAAAVTQADLVVGSGAEALVQARGHGRWMDALPRASDAHRLPLSLRQPRL